MIINRYTGRRVVAAASHILLTLVRILLIVFLKHETLTIVLVVAREVGKSIERLAIVFLGVSDVGQAGLLLQFVLLWLVLMQVSVLLAIFISLIEQPLIFLLICHRLGLLQPREPRLEIVEFGNHPLGRELLIVGSL